MNANEYQPAYEQFLVEINNRLKDMEEKQRLMRDRVLLIGKNIVDDRESTVSELAELKGNLLKIKEENIKIQDFLKNIAGQISESARKEELLMLARQIELFMTSQGKGK